MAFGAVEEDTLVLNEDTLWSGGRSDGGDPAAHGALPARREALFAGRLAEAETLTHGLQGLFGESYQPLGDLRLCFEHGGAAGVPGSTVGYRREFDLARGLQTVSCRVGGTRFTREAFVSHPDRVVVVRLRAEGPDPLRLRLGFTSPHPDRVAATGGGLRLDGRAPAHVEPADPGAGEPAVYEDGGRRGMPFCARLLVRGPDAPLRPDGETPGAEAPERLNLIFTAATGFAGFDRETDADADALAAQRLEAAAAWNGGRLLARHIADHASLFGRVSLRLEPSRDGVPTAERIRAYETEPAADPGLACLTSRAGWSRRGRPGP